MVSEIVRWKSKWGDQNSPPSTLIETLNSFFFDFYPNIYKILMVLAIMPVSTAKDIQYDAPPKNLLAINNVK